jgi:pyridoxal phosphate enzyme (YggS family)
MAERRPYNPVHRSRRLFFCFMPDLVHNLDAVHQRIALAAQVAGRDPRSVALLAVSKTFPAEDVRAAHAAGQRAFGENYVQESITKIEALADLRAALEWHFIGPLQSNKTKPVAQHFDWVHSVDRLKIAERLSEQRPPDLPPLNVCLQVNVSGEASKSGIAPAEAPALARAMAALPGLRLRGLMSIPEPAGGIEEQRAPHRRLRELFDQLRADGLALDTLSMGMSGDLEAAVLEGATIVRVGTAIFGARDYSN